MKHIITIASICFLFSFMGNAQVNPHAIGVRGGSGTFGYGGEISYQHGFGSANRLELDLGWRRRTSNNHNFRHGGISGIYHWVWNITDGLNWFVGPGGQLGYYRDHWDNGNDGLTLSIGGQIGIEYDFNSLGAPLLLGLDTRPMFGFIGSNSGAGYGGAFSLRFTF